MNVAPARPEPREAPLALRLDPTGFTLGRAPATAPSAPIGLYDSGVGGLTVLAAVARRLPHERFVYIADQAHVPYGGRPLEEVRGFAGSLARYLFDRGCKAAVMACNISSATALPEVEAAVGAEHVLGVIRPGAHAAKVATRNGRVGVLATEGTVASGAYLAAMRDLDASLVVVQSACPRFVPLVEAEAADGPDAHDAARDYIAPLIAAGVDTVVLGCTHYPFLQATLRRVAPELTFVDPAEETAAVLAATLTAHHRVHDRPRDARHALHTTGDAEQFARQLARLAPDLDAEVSRLPWVEAHAAR